MSKIDIERYGPTEDPATWPIVNGDSNAIHAGFDYQELSEIARQFERGYKIAIGVMLAAVFGFNAWLVWLIWFSRG